MKGLHLRVHLRERPRYVHLPAGRHRVLIIGLPFKTKRGFAWHWPQFRQLDRCCKARRNELWIARGHP